MDQEPGRSWDSLPQGVLQVCCRPHSARAAVFMGSEQYNYSHLMSHGCLDCNETAVSPTAAQGSMMNAFVDAGHQQLCSLEQLPELTVSVQTLECCDTASDTPYTGACRMWLQQHCSTGPSAWAALTEGSCALAMCDLHRVGANMPHTWIAAERRAQYCRVAGKTLAAGPGLYNCCFARKECNSTNQLPHNVQHMRSKERTQQLALYMRWYDHPTCPPCLQEQVAKVWISEVPAMQAVAQ